MDRREIILRKHLIKWLEDGNQDLRTNVILAAMEEYAQEVKTGHTAEERAISGKWVRCKKVPPHDLWPNGGMSRYELDKWYQICFTELSNGHLIIHAFFGCGLMADAPFINEYFDMDDLRDTNPRIAAH